jgi:phosphatidylserine/phosphatidylglycerophosphate/cardiolipin synthase-like enzyme
MKRQFSFSLLCGFLFALSTPLFSIDIIELHRNDAVGRPTSLGKAVTVTGVVTVPSGLLSATTFDVFIQDSTAGINIFSSKGDIAYLHLGDLVNVSGTISYLYGLTYIKEPSEITVLAHNQPLPDPLRLTCADVAGTFFADRSEPNESRLISINNVQVTGIGGDIYTISDTSGSTQLYLDPDAKLPALPDGAFNLIGILKQVDPSTRPPIKAGYRIMPRFSSDIISRGAPLLVQELQEAAILPFSVELAWQTDRPGTSLVRFGMSSGYEMGAVGDSTLVTSHRVKLEGLEPSTLYCARAWSSDATGTMISDSLLFMTASGRAAGTIAVYFTQSVDASKAWRDVANGKVDLSQIIVERINQAKYSLDVHYYSFTHSDIAMALINAKKRGVSVRFICENDALSTTSSKISWLTDAGIPVLSDRSGLNDGEGASHNKFVIIDHRDKSSGLDDYLWTGSSNASIAGATQNGENMLLIQDESLCATYTIEFNEMWGSETEAPNSELSRFGSRKTDNTPHRFNIGGRWIEQYMSPSDNTESKIISTIQSADHSLYFCILAFTQTTVLNAMRSQYSQIPGMVIRGIFDRESVSSDYSVYDAMAGTGSTAWSPAADVHLDVLRADLHHKYLIVDANYADSDPTVVTGSHNWSDAANTRNDENTLIIHDRRIANLYSQEFAARYQESGGTGEIISQVLPLQALATSPAGWVLLQNYPNPFNNTTTINWKVFAGAGEKAREIRIYDRSGVQVSRLVLDAGQAGIGSVIWDGCDDRGHSLPSGVYWARFNAAASRAIKMLLIR